MLSRLLAPSLAFLLLVLSLVPLHAQNVRPPGDAVNIESVTGPSNALGDESVSDFWRTYRGGDPSDIDAMVAGPIEGQVMQRTGQPWRVLREEYIGKYAIWFPGGVILILALFYILRGKMRITDGRSGKMMPRFSLTARIVHWFMAIVFILLGLTGLVILLSRAILVPLFGSSITATLSGISFMMHNILGPLFVVALLLMFIVFVRGNFFQIVDLKWIMKLGGLLGGHVSSRRFNFGEKSWFWLVILLGIVMSATGLALEFPYLFEDIRLLQLSTILHGVGAVALISVAIGHIYVGTIGMEGSIEGMTKGEVDENWAKEHHDLWYEEMKNKTSASDK